MIKKISQLNPLPLSAYVADLMPQDSQEAIRRYNEMLFEVSYETANHVTDEKEGDQIDYYTSYNINLSGLNEALRINDLCAALSNIYNGSLSVVSGDFYVGSPNAKRNDRLPHEHDSISVDTKHDFYVYSKAFLNNQTTIHGVTEFHNNVVLKCGDNDANNRENPILSVEGRSRFTKLIDGVAYRAQWGDLAEYYSADEKYEPGTLVKFGGKNEITIAKEKANGVVTTEPGVILNGADDMENPVGVALAGKVPIRIRGPVHKFDKIVLSRTDPGIGVVYNFAPMYEIVGRALEENLDKEEKLVMCATKFNLI